MAPSADPAGELIRSRLRSWFGASSGISVTAIGAERAIFPEEEAYVTSAVPKRRVEFSTGRWCAREALRELGINPAPIPVGRLREPVWPAGVIGTITHSAHLSAAVVAFQVFRGIGIDVLDTRDAAEILADAAGIIASEEEERMAAPMGCDPRALLFSTKESVIKAISAELGRFVDFTEIQVTLAGARFEAACPGRLSVRGWWEVGDELIVTGAVLS